MCKSLKKTPFSIHSPIRGREGTKRVFAEEWFRNPSIVWGLRHKPYQRKSTLETVPNANLGGGAKWDLRGIIIIGVKQTERERKNYKHRIEFSRLRLVTTVPSMPHLSQDIVRGSGLAYIGCLTLTAIGIMIDMYIMCNHG